VGRFLAIDRGAEWIKVPDLNTARWGRPSVGTIGGKITGTVHCTATGHKINFKQNCKEIPMSFFLKRLYSLHPRKIKKQESTFHRERKKTKR
jgi:hypothetical protein